MAARQDEQADDPRVRRGVVLGAVDFEAPAQPSEAALLNVAESTLAICIQIGGREWASNRDTRGNSLAGEFLMRK
jgi:hypothetical protein